MGDHHTPGPWHVGTGKATTIVYAADGYAVANATTYHGRHDQPAEANAALIAAAPDMLTALQMVDRWASGYGTATQSEMRQWVRAAIAKAEGRS